MVIDIDNLDHDLVNSILQTCTKFELPCNVEFSGRKGFHLWFFFECPIKKAWLRSLGNFLAPGHEIFPKQNTSSKDQPGNLIKMPLGLHRATAKRCLFVDTQFRTYHNQWQYLKKIGSQRIVEEHLLGILEIIKKSVIVPTYERQPVINTFPKTSKCPLRFITGYDKPLRSCIISAIQQGIPQGSRNGVSHCIASEALHRGFTREEARSILLMFNSNCSPPMYEQEPISIVDRVYSQKTTYYYGCFHPLIIKFCQRI